tara:strand:- start:10007 stop:10429 length:423 start_codon:yes stop_codon:yes gene_type:complete
MINKLKLGCAALILAPSMTIAAEVHKDVTAAVNYSLPELTCIQPVLPGKGIDVVESDGKVQREDVDSYKLGRYKRQENRWVKCVAKYKKGLMKDFETLKDSASHGLTEAQAKTILANMANIQAALVSPNGIPQPKESAKP